VQPLKKVIVTQEVFLVETVVIMNQKTLTLKVKNLTTGTMIPGLHPGECFEKYHSLKKYK
jgi:hypothetical protein